jgi:hypothetical protein
MMIREWGGRSFHLEDHACLFDEAASYTDYMFVQAEDNFRGMCLWLGKSVEQIRR